MRVLLIVTRVVDVFRVWVVSRLTQGSLVLCQRKALLIQVVHGPISDFAAACVEVSQHFLKD